MSASNALDFCPIDPAPISRLFNNAMSRCTIMTSVMVGLENSEGSKVKQALTRLVIDYPDNEAVEKALPETLGLVVCELPREAAKDVLVNIAMFSRPNSQYRTDSVTALLSLARACQAEGNPSLSIDLGFDALSFAPSHTAQKRGALLLLWSQEKKLTPEARRAVIDTAREENLILPDPVPAPHPKNTR